MLLGLTVFVFSWQDSYQKRLAEIAKLLNNWLPLIYDRIDGLDGETLCLKETATDAWDLINGLQPSCSLLKPDKFIHNASALQASIEKLYLLQ